MQMSQTIDEPRTRRWTRDEYMRLSEIGFFDGQRVELVGGEILTMSAQKDRHIAGITLVDYALRPVFGPGFIIRIQSPLDLGLESLPEPDVMAIRGTPRNPLGVATSAELVVEVSDTTLLYDQQVKASLYAAAGIADYWVLNLVDNRLELRRDPIIAPNARFGHAYRHLIALSAADVVHPLAAPTAAIQVADLLP
jgi:Uma2 family endonuclease